LHDPVDPGLVEVELRVVADQREAEPAQRVRHEPCIVRRVCMARHAAVGGVADDERDALLRVRGHQNADGHEDSRRQ